MGKLVSYQLKNDVAEVTINNPPVNALNAQVMVELRETVFEIEAEGARAVIITGAGDKAFVAGADISQFPSLDEKTAQDLSSGGQSVFDAVDNLPMPVIAAINGFALGGGCELALACDIRISAENVLLGQPEINLGIIPGYGGTQRLPRLVGIGKAKELIFTGEAITAEAALEIGMVEKVVPQGQALEAARKMAEIIATKGPLAMKAAKQAVVEGVTETLAEGQDLEARLFGGLFATEDQKEGALAFLEKRKPNFKGE